MFFPFLNRVTCGHGFKLELVHVFFSLGGVESPSSVLPPETFACVGFFFFRNELPPTLITNLAKGLPLCIWQRVSPCVRTQMKKLKFLSHANGTVSSLRDGTGSGGILSSTSNLERGSRTSIVSSSARMKRSSRVSLAFPSLFVFVEERTRPSNIA